MQWCSQKAPMASQMISLAITAGAVRPRFSGLPVSTQVAAPVRNPAGLIRVAAPMAGSRVLTKGSTPARVRGQAQKFDRI